MKSTHHVADIYPVQLIQGKWELVYRPLWNADIIAHMPLQHRPVEDIQLPKSIGLTLADLPLQNLLLVGQADVILGLTKMTGSVVLYEGRTCLIPTSDGFLRTENGSC